jgi:DNA-binding transcriptional LysR family regulator
MLRKVPPLGATEAFVLAARTASFRVAADEMALSPSAFSRRIQQLETFVGAPLFDRTQSGMPLTDAGSRYLAEVEPALEAICRATEGLREQGASAKLRVGVSQTLAVTWLMRRLTRIYQDCGVEVELVITRSYQALRSGSLDLAIWAGTEVGQNTASDRIIDLDGVPVSTSVLLDGSHAPRDFEELLQHRLLTPRQPPDIWQGWFAATGYDGPPPTFVSAFDNPFMVYEAAVSGLGVALAVPLLTDRCLDDARLQLCSDLRLPLGLSYNLYYCSPEMARRRHVRAVAEWLIGEADAGARSFDDWWKTARAARQAEIAAPAAL